LHRAKLCRTRAVAAYAREDSHDETTVCHQALESKHRLCPRLR
jgi:hypothetical protein